LLEEGLPDPKGKPPAGGDKLPAWYAETFSPLSPGLGFQNLNYPGKLWKNQKMFFF